MFQTLRISWIALAFALGGLLALASPVDASSLPTLTVESTGDSGDDVPGDGLCHTIAACTLRAAIEELNAGSGGTIEFNVGPSVTSPGILVENGPLVITQPIEIDGTTESSYAGSPVVQLNRGGATGTNAFELTSTANGAALRGLSVVGFAKSVYIVGADDVEITDNYIGLEYDGITAWASQDKGIQVTSNAFNTLIENNVIAGFLQEQIALHGPGAAPLGAVVRGNIIGLTATETSTAANGIGIFLSTAHGVTIGGHQEADRNIIGGNSHGFYIQGGGAPSSDPIEILGNYIGVTSGGAIARENTAAGIYSRDAEQVVIGDGAFGGGNVISGNTGVAIALATGSDGFVIKGNLIGLAPDGQTVMSNIGDGINIQAGAHTIGGTGVYDGNVISGNSDQGIQLTGAHSTVILGNIIGLDKTGFVSGGLLQGNQQQGILLSSADNVQIGDGTPQGRNMVSNNGDDGIKLIGTSTATKIWGNWIGVDATGVTAAGNQASGVASVGGPNTEIGGGAPELGNVISGNENQGVYLTATSNGVYNNAIGVGADRVTAVPNGPGGAGIVVFSTGNTIGNAASGNQIWYNNGHGIDSTQPTVAFGNSMKGNGAGQMSLPGVAPAAPSVSFTGWNAGNLQYIINLPAGTHDVYVYLSGDVSGVCGAGGTVQGELLIATFSSKSGSVHYTTEGTIAVGGLHLPGFALSAQVRDSSGTNGMSAMSTCMMVGDQFTVDTVTNAADLSPGDSSCYDTNNACSLYAAVQEANANSGVPATIHFSIGGASAAIDGSVLPSISSPISLRGDSKPNYDTGARICVDGTGSGYGLRFLAGSSGSVVRGLSVIDLDVGIQVDGSGIAVAIYDSALGQCPISGAGNIDGLEVANGANVLAVGNTFAQNTGKAIDASGSDIILHSNTIGYSTYGNAIGVYTAGIGTVEIGDMLGRGNVITSNSDTGIFIDGSSGASIEGNYIGTDRTMQLDAPNTILAIQGTSAPGLGINSNVIGCWGYCITLQGLSSSGQTLYNNWIGVSPVGTDLRPSQQGVTIDSSHPGGVVIGAVGSGNVIFGPTSAGPGHAVHVGSGSFNLIQGNYIGVTPELESPGGLGRGGVRVAGPATDTTVGGFAAGEGNVIGNVERGFYSDSGNAESVVGNYIGDTTVEGIYMQSPGTIQGNHVGFKPNGDAWNGVGSGILLQTYASTVGGGDPGEANVIGNYVRGINVWIGGSGCIDGNLIGLDENDEPHPNGVGIHLQSTAGSGIGIGACDNTPSGNVVSGNTGDGITADSFGPVILGNIVGLDSTGTLPVGNDGNGISASAAGAIIGDAGAGNTVSANGGSGILVSAACLGASEDYNPIVRSNNIGAKIGGLSGNVGNALHGIQFDCIDSGIIGGGPTHRNIIIDNGGWGIDVASADGPDGVPATTFVLSGSWVGVQGNGALAPNLGGGMHFWNVDDVYIDGTNDPNIVSGHSGTGIWLEDVVSGAVRDNFIGTSIGATGTNNHDLVQDPTEYGNGGVGLLLDNADYFEIGGLLAGQGNLISGNRGYGVHINAASVGGFLAGNIIGLDGAGAELPNTPGGVYLEGNYNIGNSVAADPNVISGNGNGESDDHGITIFGAGADSIQVVNNLVGTDLTGTVARPNDGDGIYISGADAVMVGNGAASGANVVSGNVGDGIDVKSSVISVSIETNIVGLSASGLLPLGNGFDGISTDAGMSTIIDNVVSANGGSGIGVWTPATANNIVNNFVGLDVNAECGGHNGPTACSLGNQQYGIFLGSGENSPAISQNWVAGNGYSGIELGFANTGDAVIDDNVIGVGANNQEIPNGWSFGDEWGSGIVLSSPGTLITGNIIGWNAGAGVYATPDALGTVIESNFIGMDGTGPWTALPNKLAGILLEGAHTSVVGGATGPQGNVISGNTGHGVSLIGADDVSVENNIIGLTGDGLTARGNGLNGVDVYESDNTAILDNIISANQNGINVESTTANNPMHTEIQANIIGLDINGMAGPNGNLDRGISLIRVTSALIGGPNLADGNVISDNGVGPSGDGQGIFIYDDLADGSPASQFEIYNNVIGLEVDETSAAGNHNQGLYIRNVDDVIIGGLGKGNIISDNQGHGIYLDAVQIIRVDENIIGLDGAGTCGAKDGPGACGIGNLGSGIQMESASGPVLVRDNRIAGNHGWGLYLDGSLPDWGVVSDNVLGVGSGGQQIPNGWLDSGPTSRGGMYINHATTDIEYNTIAFSQGPGLRLGSQASDALVRHNGIGVNHAGGPAMGNQDIGLYLDTVDSVTVYDNFIAHTAGRGVYVADSPNLQFGLAAQFPNIVAGNDGGLLADGNSGNLVIENNVFGIDNSGTTPLANGVGRASIEIWDVAGATIVDNVLGSDHDGIKMFGLCPGADLNPTIQGNWIGMDVNGAAGAVTMGGSGISLNCVSSATIGGTGAGQGNIIGDVNTGIYIEGDSGSPGDGTDATVYDIRGNLIGLDTAGAAAPVAGHGISAINVDDVQILGMFTPQAISNSGGLGIFLDTVTRSDIMGNMIGADQTGAGGMGNNGGIMLILTDQTTIGGAVPGEGNIIVSSALDGVYVGPGSTDTVIQGNFIGVDVFDAVAGNGENGIESYAQTTIGGDANGAGNLVSGNVLDGILLSGAGAASSTIHGNTIGLSYAQAGASNGDGAVDAGEYGNSGAGIQLMGVTGRVDIGGAIAGSGNFISGNRGGGISIDDASGATPVPHCVQGNVIGLGGGNERIGNVPFGVQLHEQGTSIGNCDDSGVSNVVSANFGPGILLQSTANDGFIQGNLIGLAQDETGANDNIGGFTAGEYGNDGPGIHVLGATNVIVGGDDIPHRNYISGNSQDGIFLSGGANNICIDGNDIGLLPDGAAAGNGGSGIHMDGATDILIGKCAFGLGFNAIGGNFGDGISGSNADQATVLGNLIGMNRDYMIRPNEGNGIYLVTSEGAIIGQTSLGNVVSGNRLRGVVFGGPNTATGTVRGNWIGTTPGGAVAGNEAGGVLFHVGANNAQVGGPAAGEGNIIHHNLGPGVSVGIAPASTQVTIVGNSIVHNTGGGIDLGDDGVRSGDDVPGPATDPGNDADVGDNDLQTPPSLAVTVLDDPAEILITVDSTPGETFLVDLYATAADDVTCASQPDGDLYLGRHNLLTDSSGSEPLDGTATLSLTVLRDLRLPSTGGYVLTATATSASGNTSEFSDCAVINTDDPCTNGIDDDGDGLIDGDDPQCAGGVEAAAIVVNSNGSAPDDDLDDGVCNAGGVCTLRAAIMQANAIGSPFPQEILFDLDPESRLIVTSSTDPLPTITTPVLIDGAAFPSSLHPNGEPKIRLQGNGPASPDNRGLYLVDGSGGSTVRGLSFERFDQGIRVQHNSATPVTIEQNWIGAVGCNGDGNPATLTPATGLGNRIGALVASGAVHLNDNVISCNQGRGVLWTHATGMVSNNIIGLSADGAPGHGNGRSGMQLQNVGTVVQNNIISGNTEHGLFINATTTPAMVQNNLIGTDASGVVARGNGLNGLYISGTNGHLIRDNVVSGNHGNGISLYLANGNVLTGNAIGSNESGTIAIANGANGITVQSGLGNQIGQAGQGNIIAFNGGNGVMVRNDPSPAVASNGNSIRFNDIRGNANIGINLVGPADLASGVTPNDPADADTGANGLLNAPRIRQLNTDRASAVVGYAGAPNQALIIDAYQVSACHSSGFGDASAHLGTVSVTTDAQGQASLNMPFTALAPGYLLSLTATHAQAGTSEFSGCARDPIVVNDLSDAPDMALDGVCETATSNGICTLRAALGEALADLVPDTILFDLGAGPHNMVLGSALPSISSTVSIDNQGDAIIVSEASAQPILSFAAGSDGSRVFGLHLVDSAGPGIAVSQASGVSIENSILGLDATGQGRGNGGVGISLSDAPYTDIRGVTVANSAGHGIDITGTSHHTSVTASRIGTDVTGTSEQQNGGSGISIFAAQHVRIGGATPSQGNVVSANALHAIVIVDDATYDVRDVLIRNNRIGTDASGQVALGNGAGGLLLGGMDNSLIAQNVVSSNTGTQIHLYGGTSTDGARNNQFYGNFVGTDAAGTTALPGSVNGPSSGFLLSGQANANHIGGRLAGQANVISGNQGDAVQIDTNSDQNRIVGNKIGTTLDGLSALPNNVAAGPAAITIQGGSKWNVVGGTAPGAGNLISGNHANGVAVLGAGSTNNQVAGNTIGLAFGGLVPLPNGDGTVDNGIGFGVVITNAPDTLVGGPFAGNRNTLAANEEGGILIEGSTAANTRVFGNSIGTNIVRAAGLANGGHGVLVTGTGSGQTFIGGTGPGEANTIAFQPGYAVHIGASSGPVSMRGNSLTGNELGAIGGPHSAATPELSRAIQGSVTIEGLMVDSGTYSVDFYISSTCTPGLEQGLRYAGTQQVAVDGAPEPFVFTSPVTTTVGQFVTATATTVAGSTSSFSPCTTIVAPDQVCTLALALADDLIDNGCGVSEFRILGDFPLQASADVQQVFPLQVTAVSESNVPIQVNSATDVQWSVTGGSSKALMRQNALDTAGRTGNYLVTATLTALPTNTATAAIELVPGAIARLVMSPEVVTISNAASDQVPLQMAFFDKSGNPIGSPICEPSVSVQPGGEAVGRITGAPGSFKFEPTGDGSARIRGWCTDFYAESIVHVTSLEAPAGSDATKVPTTVANEVTLDPATGEGVPTSSYSVGFAKVQPGASVSFDGLEPTEPVEGEEFMPEPPGSNLLVGGTVTFEEAAAFGTDAKDRVALNVETQLGSSSVFPGEIDGASLRQTLDDLSLHNQAALFLRVSGTLDGQELPSEAPGAGNDLNDLLGSSTFKVEIPCSYFQSTGLSSASVRLIEYNSDGSLVKDTTGQPVFLEAAKVGQVDRDGVCHYQYDIHIDRYSAFAIVGKALSSTGGGGGGGGAPSSTEPDAVGRRVQVPVSDAVLSRVDVDFETTTGSVSPIETFAPDTPPASAAALPANVRVVRYMEVHANEGTVLSATFHVRIPASEVPDGARAVLLHEVNGQWIAENPISLSLDGDHYVGVASGSCCSLFAIAFDEEAPKLFGELPAGIQKGTIRVAVDAFDNVGINRVEFRVDGKLVAVHSQAPFEHQLHTPQFGNGDHLLRIIAYDVAGNSHTTESFVTFDNPTSAANLVGQTFDAARNWAGTLGALGFAAIVLLGFYTIMKRTGPSGELERLQKIKLPYGAQSPPAAKPKPQPPTPVAPAHKPARGPATIVQPRKGNGGQP